MWQAWIENSCWVGKPEKELGRHMGTWEDSIEIYFQDRGQVCRADVSGWE
jgi:hypothetical protein